MRSSGLFAAVVAVVLGVLPGCSSCGQSSYDATRDGARGGDIVVTNPDGRAIRLTGKRLGPGVVVDASASKEAP